MVKIAFPTGVSLCTEKDLLGDRYDAEARAIRILSRVASLVPFPAAYEEDSDITHFLGMAESVREVLESLYKTIIIRKSILTKNPTFDEQVSCNSLDHQFENLVFSRRNRSNFGVEFKKLAMG